jgi:hypothetical protein
MVKKTQKYQVPSQARVLRRAASRASWGSFWCGIVNWLCFCSFVDVGSIKGGVSLMRVGGRSEVMFRKFYFEGDG